MRRSARDSSRSTTKALRSSTGSRRSRAIRATRMRRLFRLVLTLGVTGLAVAYLVVKIDLSRTWRILSHASVGWFLLAVAIMAVTVWPMAWRWQRLLLAQGIRDRLLWLVRAYFTA